VAKEESTPITDDEGWEKAEAGIGEEWDFDKNGDLVGVFVKTRHIDLPERSQRPGPDGELRKTAQIWEFMLPEGEIVFIWDSHQLAELMTAPGMGDQVKIRFKGYKKFDGSDGPRQVKEYDLWHKPKSK
jgi:hypothetical protein